MNRVQLCVAVVVSLALSQHVMASLVLRAEQLPAGSSTLSGYVGWYDLDSLDLDIDRSGGFQPGGNEPINIGIGEVSRLELSKLTGVGSPELFLHSINGNSIGEVEIRLLDFDEGANRPIAAWKLDRAFVASYAVSSDSEVANDDFSLLFTKIAFATVVDGKASVEGWDLVRNTPWTEHGLDDDLQSELENGLTTLAGDFNADGVVDGSDFILWQQGGSGNPLSAEDLAAWENNLGAVANRAPSSAPVPEPATWCGLALVLFGMALRRTKGEQRAG